MWSVTSHISLTVSDLVSFQILPVIENAITSDPGTAFHTMALRQFQRCATREDGINFLLTTPGLVERMLDCLFDEHEIGPYELVEKTFITMAKQFEAQTMQYFFPGGADASKPSVFDSYLANGTETIRIRILDLFASFSASSPGWFDLLEGRGHIERLFGELDEDDLLARLSAFQLLGKVCSSEKGLKSMRKYHVPQKMLAMLDIEEAGLNNIVLSNAITLIGELASFSDFSFQIMVGDQPTLIKALHSHIEHDSDEVVQAVIFALARIACTLPGLELLLRDENKLVVRDWLEYGHSSNAEMKATTFYTLSIILDRLASNETAAEKVHQIYARMGLIDYPSIEVLNKNLTGGLSELKYAALALLRSTLRYSWGLEELIRFPGIADWLLDRSTENTKRGHEMKFDAIEQAIKHPKAKALIGINNFHNFLEFVKLGVYYQRAESAVKVREEHG